jgi:hypothetical protein
MKKKSVKKKRETYTFNNETNNVKAYNFFTTKIYDRSTKNNNASTKFQTPKQMNSAPKKINFPPK